MRTPRTEKVLDGATANGVGTTRSVADYNHIVVNIYANDTPTGTVKAQVSTQETPPNFAAAQSPTNRWEYAQMKDLEDGSNVDGDTGVSAAGSDIARMFEVNTNNVRWVNFELSGRTGGAFHADITKSTT